MGMVIFAEAGVDYVTLETGLGGRLDATTAVENPAACVITSISLDHMQVSWKYSFRDRRREGRDHGAGCSGDLRWK